MSNDDWKGEGFIKNVQRSREGQGRNLRSFSSYVKWQEQEATVKRLKPFIENLIDDHKEKGRWDGIKDGSMKHTVWSMLKHSSELANERYDDVVMTLKRIKQDGIKW